MILSGKELSASIKAELAQQVKSFPEKYGRVPHLVVVLIGNDPASESYVAGKAKASALVGIKNTTIRRPVTISEDELLGLIAELNADDGVDGILVQLPLPEHISESKIVAAIAQEKERAVVVGRSNIVGMPVARLLMNENATVTIAHSHTVDLPSITREAEILVVATGHPHLVTADMVTEGVVVIDVGISRNPETGKLVGDVDFDNVAPKSSVITPVPGGVGPMTICSLMENTVECFLNRMER